VREAVSYIVAADAQAGQRYRATDGGGDAYGRLLDGKKGEGLPGLWNLPIDSFHSKQFRQSLSKIPERRLTASK